jgi:alpha-tubulin suppressor-like RCC1 family protein
MSKLVKNVYLRGKTKHNVVNTIPNVPVPETPVFGQSNWDDLTSLEDQIIQESTIYVAGSNQYKQITDSSDNYITTPVAIEDAPSGSPWIDFAASYHSFVGITADGKIWGKGQNYSGELSLYNEGNIYTTWQEINSNSNTDFIQVENGGQAGYYFLKQSDGSVWYIGNASLLNKTVPFWGAQKITGASNEGFVKIEPSYSGIVGIKSDGTLWGQGWENNNSLGGIGASSQFKQIDSDTDWVDVAAGYRRTYALKNDGTVWGWGFNVGFLSYNSTSYIKHKLTNDDDIRQITCQTHGNHVMCLREIDGEPGGSVWGGTEQGYTSLVRVQNSSSPKPVWTLSSSYNANPYQVTFNKISARGRTCLALGDNGELWGIGYDDGNFITGNSYVWNRIGTDTDWKNFKCFEYHMIGYK